MEQTKKRTIASKGTRLKWESLKKSKPVKLTAIMIEGKKVSATELPKHVSEANLLVP